MGCTGCSQGMGGGWCSTRGTRKSRKDTTPVFAALQWRKSQIWTDEDGQAYGWRADDSQASGLTAVDTKTAGGLTAEDM